jgi:hypothetical protein
MVINATNYADAAVTNGITNYYVVTAVNANGQSGDSPQASAAAPPPAITASGSAVGGAFTLSWPVSALNFTLCSAPALGPGANWTPVTNGQAVAGGTIFVTLSISGPPAQFFRLVYSPAP